MLVAIIGENCVGKSTLAKGLNTRLNAKIFSGKDYLRLDKSPSIALDKFKNLLHSAETGENIIYLITEKEHLNLLPKEAFTIVLTAELEIIKERFRCRLGGNIPLALEKALEAKHGVFDDLQCDLKLDANYSIEDVLKKLNLM